ncbi:MAG: hypothetical protein HFH30_10730 [Eubacterium sp.]|nr:hypothetical protein [Eubacterium sp.]
METLFLKLFNMSITAGWLILAVMLLRLLLHKTPKSMRCILWAMVGIRLLCPLSFESAFSLIPSAETIPQDILYSHAPAVYSGIPILNQSINPLIADAFTPDAAASANPLQIYVFIASIVWITGMAAIVSYAFISYLMLRRKVRESVRQDDHTWLCDHVPTPFILGIFRPRIILPSAVSPQDLTYVLAHEYTHLKRRDHWWKLLAFLLLTIYWFHPLVWIAYRLFSQDLELACDEKVIADMGTESKKPYADALINCSKRHCYYAACPLAFCEISVAKRIKAVLRYKKPAVWIIAAAVILCIISGFCFLTDPAGTPLRDTASAGRPEYIRLVSADRAYIITSKTAMKQVLQFLGEIQTERTTDAADSNTGITINDKTNQITIYDQDKSEEYFFDRSCRQVWTIDENGSVLLRKIYSPNAVRRFFNARLEKIADQALSSSDSSGTHILYTFKNSPDDIDPCISLSMEDNTFSFAYSAFSSYLAFGTYQLADQTLTLRTSDGLYTYVFTVRQDAFVFDASKSSAIPKYRYSGISKKAESPVPDGAVFTSGSADSPRR